MPSILLDRKILIKINGEKHIDYRKVESIVSYTKVWQIIFMIKVMARMFDRRLIRIKVYVFESINSDDLADFMMREVNTKAAVIRNFGDLNQREGEDSDSFFERCQRVCDSLVQGDLPDSPEELKGYRKMLMLMLKVTFVAGLKPDVRKVVAKNYTKMKTLTGVKELASVFERDSQR
jgi:hypothetical protein